MLRRISIGCILLLLFLNVSAQHTYVPIGSYTDEVLNRMEIINGTLPESYFHSGSHSFIRSSIAHFADSFPIINSRLSNRDFFNLSYLQNDNPEWTISQSSKSKKHPVKGLYDYQSALYAARIPDFNLFVNPVLYYEMGSSSFNSHAVGINNRGVEVRGNIGNNIGFYSQVSDEIIIPNQQVNDFFRSDTVIAGAGFYKPLANYGFNYFLASGYITLKINKYIDAQFGESRNFIGDGVRTFILSDFSRDYLYLRLNTRIWKMHYSNIFAQTLNYEPVTNYIINPRKYFATHHLSLNIGKHFNLGCFETIIFQRDSGYADKGFEPHYLNPIIFYKAVENGLNSTDKSIVGLNFKANILRQFQLYGQWVFSEFVFNELINNRGFWANKYAYQLGLKWMNVGNIKNLDLQIEHNKARPYMYTSFSTRQTFTNYNQNLAHPLGANFTEWIVLLRYQPLNRLTFRLRLFYALYGNDTNGSNWGKNIGLSYYSRVQDYGNEVGQGVKTTLTSSEFSATWMIKHNVFIDLKHQFRQTHSDLKIFETQQQYISLGIRVNIGQRHYDF